MNVLKIDKIEISELENIIRKEIREADNNLQRLKELLYMQTNYKKLLTILDKEPRYIINGLDVITKLLSIIFGTDNMHQEKFEFCLRRYEKTKKTKELDEFKEKIYEKAYLCDLEIQTVSQEDYLEKTIEYTKLLKKIKTRQELSTKCITTIMVLLRKYGFEDFAIVHLCETLKQNVAYKKEAVPKDEVLRMMRTEIEELPQISLSSSRDIMVQNEINAILNWRQEYPEDPDMLLYNLPSYISERWTEEEFKKIYYEVLRNIQTNIVNNILLLKEDEFYLDDEGRNMLINEHKKECYLYNRIKEIFELELPQQEEINNVDFFTENTAIKMLFSERSNNTTYLEGDIDSNSFAKEYLRYVLYLLKKKRKGCTNKYEDKQLINNANYGQLRELKASKVRIFYKNLKNNTIVIVGAGVKKDQIDPKLLKAMANRPIKISNEAQLVGDDMAALNRISDICEEKKQRGYY